MTASNTQEAAAACSARAVALLPTPWPLGQSARPGPGVCKSLMHSRLSVSYPPTSRAPTHPQRWGGSADAPAQALVSTAPMFTVSGGPARCLSTECVKLGEVWAHAGRQPLLWMALLPALRRPGLSSWVSWFGRDQAPLCKHVPAGFFPLPFGHRASLGQGVLLLHAVARGREREGPAGAVCQHSGHTVVPVRARPGR